MAQQSHLSSGVSQPKYPPTPITLTPPVKQKLREMRPKNYTRLGARTPFKTATCAADLTPEWCTLAFRSHAGTMVLPQYKPDAEHTPDAMETTSVRALGR